MIFSIILLVLIGAYAGFVIYKRVKDIKKGKYCNCGCDNCTNKCNSKKDVNFK